MPLSSLPDEGGAPAVPYVDHIARESARFREVLAATAGGERVPTCPDWDADDLLWHLAEVQWFWGTIAERGLTEKEDVDGLDAVRVARPGDREGLLAHFDASSERLQRMLTTLPPESPLWMWHSDQSAGYIRRRQAHEALIHRIDAELAAGAERAPMDCRLAADGVDEALRIMRGFPPQYARDATPLGSSVTVAVVDGFHTWTITPVMVKGVEPDGEAWEERCFAVKDGPEEGSTAEITGTAGDLDCWLWNRPAAAEITRDGDPAALDLVDQVLSSSVD